MANLRGQTNFVDPPKKIRFRKKNGCVSLHLSTSPPPRFDTFPPPKKAHLHPPKSTSPPPKKVYFIPPLKFFQRTKTTKLKVKVNVFAAQVHVEDLVVAHIEQNLTMYYAKLEWDRGGEAQRSGDRCPYLGEHGGGPHRAKPAHVQRQTGVSWWWRGIRWRRWRSTTFWRWLPWPRRSLGAAFCDMHPHIQAFWEPIWKRTLEKSQTNAASATLFPLVQAFWTNIW